jgi:nucleotide-binding universal stress UspA family protein
MGDGGPVAELIAESFERAGTELGKQRQELERASGRSIGARLVESTPVAEAIARVAQAERSDLVVMGTQGRTGLRHLLIGSVAERVVRQCPCPVLTVRRGAVADRVG